MVVIFIFPCAISSGVRVFLILLYLSILDSPINIVNNMDADKITTPNVKMILDNVWKTSTE